MHMLRLARPLKGMTCAWGYSVLQCVAVAARSARTRVAWRAREGTFEMVSTILHHLHIYCIIYMWGYIWDGVDPILWHCVGSRSYEFKKNVMFKSTSFISIFIGKVVLICLVGSVNFVLKFLGQPGKTRFEPGGNEISSGVPMAFNTKLTEPEGK